MMTAVISLLGCREEAEELAYDGNSLKVEVDDNGDNRQDSVRTRTAYTGFHTDFEAGDAIGVYAFNGKQFVNSNIKFTKQEDGKWTSDAKVIYNPAYTYYAYFPYISNPYTPATTAAKEGSDDVDTKFANFISDSQNLFWKADQFSKANYDASNLMINTGVLKGDHTIKFSLKHKRGLAIISNAVNQWYYADKPDVKYPCTPVFSGNIPFTTNNTNYFLVKPNTTTSVAGLSLSINEGKYMVSDAIQLMGTPTYQNVPSWLKITPIVEDGKPTDFSVTTTEDVVSTEKAIDTEMQNNTPANNCDLSMTNNDGSARTARTTANCYLVHAPGTYRIPLVYGNAIKNGVGNPSAYHSTTAENSNKRQNLVNHLDQEIYTGDANSETDPWIKNHSITVNGAKLVWQDSKGLIESVGVDGDFLTFKVSHDNITQGNALIAATANGTVVWSWHIWVTKEKLQESELVSVATGSHTYEVAPVNLGEGRTMEKASSDVRASSNGVTLRFNIEQKNATDYRANTYYQWGRKDPEIPATIGSDIAYDIDGNNIKFQYSSSSVSIGTTIQNPGIHYCSSSTYGPYNESNYNYWDMNQTRTGNISTATVKTIYDPCPPGFCVPTGNLYYYMGDNVSMTTWQGTNGQQGRIWKDGDSVLFFPAAGYRDYGSGTLNYVGFLGYSWSASASYSYNARYLYFDSGSWYWYHNYRAYGFSVRPVLEE